MITNRRIQSLVTTFTNGGTVKNRKLCFQIVVVLLVLISVRSWALNNANLSGGYSVLLTSAAGATPFNATGVFHFDGVSAVTASLQINAAGTLGTLTGSGSYSVANDGTGSMSISYSDGSTIGYSLGLQPSAKQVQMIESSVNGQTTGVNVVSGSAISQATALAFTNKKLKGTYGLLMAKVPLDNQNGGPADMSGVLTFDGQGNIKSASLESNFNGTLSAFTGSGTYQVNSDGSATATMTTSDGLTVNFALTLNSAGKGFQIIELTTSQEGRNDVIGGAASR